MNDISGFNISQNKLSSRIIDIKIKNETIEKLIFPFKKFDLTAIEYKPFTRFTIAKSLDEELQELIGYTQGTYGLGYFSDPEKPAEKFDLMVPELALGRGPRQRAEFNTDQLSKVENT